MRVALETEKSPLDANLEKVIPGLHHWHQENNNVMKEVDKRLVGVADCLTGLEEKVRLGFDGIVSSI